MVLEFLELLLSIFLQELEYIIGNYLNNFDQTFQI